MNHTPDSDLAREYLRAVAAEPDESQVGELKQRVVHAIARRQRMQRYRAAAAAIAALILVVASIGIHRQQKTLMTERTATAPLALPHRQFVSLGSLPKTVEPHVRRRAASMVLVANAGSSPVVRLKTSDPSVEVLWVLNTENREEASHE